MDCAREMLRPGITAQQIATEVLYVMMKLCILVKDLDAGGREVCTAHGFAEYHFDGISHGIGLRFEEVPASTIIRQHRNTKIREGMTFTIDHTILAVPSWPYHALVACEMRMSTSSPQMEPTFSWTMMSIGLFPRSVKIQSETWLRAQSRVIISAHSLTMPVPQTLRRRDQGPGTHYQPYPSDQRQAQYQPAYRL